MTARRFTYAVETHRHATPALCPVRGRLSSVALGYAPSLHDLRRGFPLFGRFSGTMGVSDFSPASMVVLRQCLPHPTRSPPGTDEISQVPCKRLPSMLRVFDRAGSSADLRLTPASVLPSACLYGVGIPKYLISRLNGWPAGFPCQRLELRLTAQPP
jgi:hypothetical protein